MSGFYKQTKWQDEELQTLDGQPRYLITGDFANPSAGAKIELISPVLIEGTPFAAAQFNRMERGIFNANAYGLTSGSGDALQVAIEDWQPVQFARALIRLHTDIAYRPTLSVNNGAVLPLMLSANQFMGVGMRTGALFEVMLDLEAPDGNAGQGAYIVMGGGGGGMGDDFIAAVLASRNTPQSMDLAFQSYGIGSILLRLAGPEFNAPILGNFTTWQALVEDTAARNTAYGNLEIKIAVNASPWAYNLYDYYAKLG